jgi:polyphosphate kinase
VLTRDLRTGTHRYIGIEIPPTVPRFLRPRAGSPLVPLECVIGANLPVLLPGLEVVEQHTFRVTRDGRPLRARGVAEGLGSRTRAAVRLEVDAAMSEAQRLRLVRSLGLEADDVDPSAAPLDLAALTALPLTQELSRTRGRPVRQPVANPPSRTPDDGAA